MNSAENKIPGYQILKELGHGGMATVYLAIQESLKREVAVKVMSELLSLDPAFGERFLREAKIVSRLIHPHIVTIYDVGSFEGRFFMSMEYVPGENLGAKINKLSLLHIVRAIREIASALAYASQNGYIHRDIKPENIMLKNEDGRAILMDFGIARACDNLSGMTQTGTAIGTPYYMSPEQAKGAKVDPRSDLYSLGVVLFQLLSGKVPYSGDSAISIGIKHISEPVPELPEYLRPTFQPLINKMMAKNASDRFQSGNELISALNALDPIHLSKITDLFSQESGQQPDETVFQPSIPSNMWGSLPLAQSSTSQIEDDSILIPKDFPFIAAEPRTTLGSASSPITEILSHIVGWYKSNVKLSAGIAALLLAVTAALLLKTIIGDAPTDEVEEQAKAPAQPPTAEASAFVKNEQMQQEKKQADLTTLLDKISTLEESLKQDVRVAPELKALYSELASIEPANNKIKSGQEKIKTAYRSHLDSLIQTNNYKAASDFFSKAVVEFPELAKSDIADKFQKKFKSSEDVIAWLAKADKLFKAEKFSGSGQEHAFGYYTKVLAAEPGNAAALLGVDKVAQQYLKLAREHMADKQYDQAENVLRKASYLNSSMNKELAELQLLLTDQQQKEVTSRHSQPVKEELPKAEEPPTKIATQEIATQLQNNSATTNSGSTSSSETVAKAEITKLLIQSQEFDNIDTHKPASLASGRVVYIGFKYANFVENNTLLTADLYDGGRTVKISTVPVFVKGESGAAFFKFVQPVAGFSIGSYYLDISLNGGKLGSYQFLIEK